MWKNIKNVMSAVSDLATIGTKEVAYQFNKASEATETVTGSLASKAAALKANYQESLEARKSGVIKPEVVKEAEVPASAIVVN